MVPGSSTESLALDVALQCQVPPDIVQRAAHLFKVTPVKTPDQHYVLWVCADAHPLSHVATQRWLHETDVLKLSSDSLQI